MTKLHLMPVQAGGKRPLCDHGEKDASADAAQVRHWRKLFGRCNWAVATGPSSLIALDEDTYKDVYVPGLLDAAIGVPLPKTVEWRSGRGGRVRVFRRPPGVEVKPGPLKERVGIPGVDVKASAGYVLIPPSVNNEGGRYEWVHSPSDTAVADAPPELIELLTMESLSDSGGSSLVETEELFLRAGDGRWERLQRFAGGLRRWGWGERAILGALRAFASAQCEPDGSIGPAKVEEIARWAVSLPAGTDVEPAAGEFVREGGKFYAEITRSGDDEDKG
jgi:hypothetical protein